MTDIAKLDVLIVYNSHIIEAPRRSSRLAKPFPPDNDSLNLAYAYFLEVSGKANLSAGLASSSCITGPGTCKSYWTYEDGNWIKNFSTVKSKLIFDKFSPKTPFTVALRHLLFSHTNVASFNSYSLFKLFFDKLKTYRKVASDAIPTVAIHTNSLHGVRVACSALKKICRDHPQSKDFGEEIILKDRYGAGGRHIFKIAAGNYSEIKSLLAKHPTLSFIIQPLLNFDRGLMYKGNHLASDIRLIFLSGKIVSCYLRIAESGDFRCNQHQGGTLIYLDKSELPKSVLKKSLSIARVLNKKSSLFTLDFLVANSGNPYLLEGNTGPGLNWDENDVLDQKESKKLIRAIVKQLARRHNNPRSPQPAHPSPHAKTPFLPLASKTLSLVLTP